MRQLLQRREQQAAKQTELRATKLKVGMASERFRIQRSAAMEMETVEVAAVGVGVAWAEQQELEKPQSCCGRQNSC
jgi:hypothetical protein